MQVLSKHFITGASEGAPGRRGWHPCVLGPPTPQGHSLRPQQAPRALRQGPCDQTLRFYGWAAELGHLQLPTSQVLRALSSLRGFFHLYQHRWLGKAAAAYRLRRPQGPLTVQEGPRAWASLFPPGGVFLLFSWIMTPSHGRLCHRHVDTYSAMLPLTILRV